MRDTWDRVALPQWLGLGLRQVITEAIVELAFSDLDGAVRIKRVLEDGKRSLECAEGQREDAGGLCGRDANTSTSKTA